MKDIPDTQQCVITKDKMEPNMEHLWSIGRLVAMNQNGQEVLDV